jgi:peptidyl-prolyl cis-trans isomerase C
MNQRKTAAMLALVFVWAAAVGAQDAAPNPTEVNPVVMTVNGDEIHAAEISLIMQNIEGFLRSQGQEAGREQVFQVASQRAVEQKLLAQEARRFGIKPDEARVAQMVELTVQQGGGRENILRTLEAGGTNLEQLTEMFREMELGRLFIEQQIKPTLKVTDEQVTEFYMSHPDLFARDEQVRARHIVFEVAADADEATDRIAREKAEAARKRALAGEDFAELAKELSEGPTAPKGGDLGFFSRATMVEPFATAAFALQPGEISDVVKSRFGYHVIKLEERREASTMSFEEAKEQARGLVVNQMTASTVGELLQTLHDKSDIKVLSETGEMVDAGAAPPPAGS